MLTIAIVNEKGGTGKTTTAVNLTAALGELGKQVLLVDLDGQAASSRWLGVEDDCRFADALWRGEGLEPIRNLLPNVALAPGSGKLDSVAHDLRPTQGGQLRKLLGAMRGFDFAVIDCPPSLGNRLIGNALLAATHAIVPVETSILAMDGLKILLTTLQDIQDGFDHHVQLTGVVACRFDARTKLSRMILDELKRALPDKVFQTVIRENVRLRECPGSGKSILEYAPDSHATEDYRALAVECLSRLGQSDQISPQQFQAVVSLRGQVESLLRKSDPPADAPAPEVAAASPAAMPGADASVEPDPVAAGAMVAACATMPTADAPTDLGSLAAELAAALKANVPAEVAAAAPPADAQKFVDVFDLSDATFPVATDLLQPVPPVAQCSPAVETEVVLAETPDAVAAELPAVPNADAPTEPAALAAEPGAMAAECAAMPDADVVTAPEFAAPIIAERFEELSPGAMAAECAAMPDADVVTAPEFAAPIIAERFEDLSPYTQPELSPYAAPAHALAAMTAEGGCPTSSAEGGCPTSSAEDGCPTGSAESGDGTERRACNPLHADGETTGSAVPQSDPNPDAKEPPADKEQDFPALREVLQNLAHEPAKKPAPPPPTKDSPWRKMLRAVGVD